MINEEMINKTVTMPESLIKKIELRAFHEGRSFTKQTVKILEQAMKDEKTTIPISIR